MKKPPFSDPTVGYYDRNATLFCGATGGVNMSHLYAEFLPLVPKGGKILDAGCGSGRDALFFKQNGYSVTAFDASPELASLATQALGEPVKVMTFLGFDSAAEFDGIWACASLLHVPALEIDAVFHRLTNALKIGAPLYVSFKYGSTEGRRGERFFNDYNEVKLQALLRRHPRLSVLKIWHTHDARPTREHELWLNSVLKRS